MTETVAAIFGLLLMLLVTLALLIVMPPAGVFWRLRDRVRGAKPAGRGEMLELEIEE